MQHAGCLRMQRRDTLMCAQSDNSTQHAGCLRTQRRDARCHLCLNVHSPQDGIHLQLVLTSLATHTHMQELDRHTEALMSLQDALWHLSPEESSDRIVRLHFSMAQTSGSVLQTGQSKHSSFFQAADERMSLVFDYFSKGNDLPRRCMNTH
eukprot:140780-Pelagomonas_calceolata.AAC.7